jgi:putative DNA primase/helicase
MNNRFAANWKLLLAIAELAGGDWPQRARDAAERLSRSGRKPSAGVRLLEAFKAYFAEHRATEVTSEAFVTYLTADPISIWRGYNRGGSITQRQVANLLDDYGIHPVCLHPTKRKDFSRQGYKLDQFSDALARYPLRDPIIQSPPNKQRKPSKKRMRVKSRKRR